MVRLWLDFMIFKVLSDSMIFIYISEDIFLDTTGNSLVKRNTPGAWNHSIFSLPQSCMHDRERREILVLRLTLLHYLGIRSI